MALRELLATLGVRVDDKELGQFEKVTLPNVLSGLKGAATAFAGAFAVKGIKDFLMNQISVGKELQHTAERLGLSTDEMQKLQFAAKGVGIEEATTAFGFLNKNIGEAITGGAEQKKTFDALGVSLKDSTGKVRSTADITLDLADKFQGMGSQAERTAIAVKLFGRAGGELLPTFAEGSKGIKEMYTEFDKLGGGMSKEFVAATGKAAGALKRMKLVTQSLKSEIALAMLPLFTKWTKKFTDLEGILLQFAKKTTVVKTALASMSVLGALSFVKMGVSAAKMLGVIGEVGPGIWGLLAAFAEFAIPAAIIAFIVLLFDDLYNMVEGNESVLGEYLDKYGDFGAKQELIDALKGAWKDLKAALVDIKPELDIVLSAIGSLAASGLTIVLKEWASTLRAIAATIDVIAGGLAAIPHLAKGLAKSIATDYYGDGNGGDDMSPEQLAAGKQARDNAYQSIGVNNPENDRSDYKAVADAISQGFDHASTAVNGKPMLAVDKNNAGAPSYVIQQTNQVEVNVDAGADAKGTGEAVKDGVGKALDEQHRRAINALRDGASK